MAPLTNRQQRYQPHECVLALRTPLDKPMFLKALTTPTFVEMSRLRDCLRLAHASGRSGEPELRKAKMPPRTRVLGRYVQGQLI